jgi:DNA helicase-2/ATP-dependent DNA helicase PcrA
MSDILTQLNPAQRKAAEHIGGPLLILAGPGSGKTKVIVHRVAYLLRTCGINPQRIMTVTFTNKAARELIERLNQLASGYINDLTIGTFHAICSRILRLEGEAVKVNPRFVIYDSDDQLSIVKQALIEEGYDTSQYSPRAILAAISGAKAQMLSFTEYTKLGSSYFEEVVAKVYKRYQQLLGQSDALDFDDLLLKTVWLLQKDKEVLERYQKRYQHIMVDEFQDTNLVQYELVKLLSGKHRNICVVGDPDQSIYSWRSADMRNILNFEKDYPEAEVVRLGQSYRSTKKILELASHVISENKQRKPIELWTDNENGEAVSLVDTFSQQEEAQFVVKEIDKIVDKGQYELKDIAVMYRTNAQSRVLEEAFIRYGTSYKLVAGTRFYERREVKDIVAYLRLIQNYDDSVSLLRIINVPLRGIGQKSIGELSTWARAKGISPFRVLKEMVEGNEAKVPLNPRAVKTMTIFYNSLAEILKHSKDMKLIELYDYLIDRTGYREYVLKQENGEERWENILELRTVVEAYAGMEAEESLSAFLEKVALVADVDSLNESEGSVTLITLHQAKGLEFPVVFIVGVEEGILPHFRSFDNPLQMEEERRLCYVGITRAKWRLYLVRAYRRSLMGGTTSNEASRFINNLPSHLIAKSDMFSAKESHVGTQLDEWDISQETVYTEVPEIKSGDRVRHNQFGEGVVVGCQPMSNDAELMVDFEMAGRKRLLLSFARLEKMD